MSNHSILIECPSCGGTGLYKGFMERPDEAVICVNCHGTGAKELSGKPFTGRKRKPGVSKIRGGSGTILDNPGKSAWMSYAEFEQKVPS
jgi:DnaJ-class molecular chaperone